MSKVEQASSNEEVSEIQMAKNLANLLLDEPYADPDDDKRVLARQLLRRHEDIGRLTARAAELEAALQARTAERDRNYSDLVACGRRYEDLHRRFSGRSGVEAPTRTPKALPQAGAGTSLHAETSVSNLRGPGGCADETEAKYEG